MIALLALWLGAVWLSFWAGHWAVGLFWLLLPLYAVLIEK